MMNYFETIHHGLKGMFRDCIIMRARQTSFTRFSRYGQGIISVVAIALLIVLLLGDYALAQSEILTKQRIAETLVDDNLASDLGAFNLFIIFFVTLGPLKVIPVFAQLTAKAHPKRRWQLATRSALISTFVITLVVILGVNVLKVWAISLPALMIAGGILLFVVAFKIVMTQYAPTVKVTEAPDNPSLHLAVTPLSFPTILPPFGIAIALTMMVIAQEIGLRYIGVFALIMVVMFLNWVCMILAQPILMFIRPVTLRILGFTLGVLQLALGVELILTAAQIEVLVIQKMLGF